MRHLGRIACTVLILCAVVWPFGTLSGTLSAGSCESQEQLDLPPGFGGPAPARVTLEQARAWQAYRRAREAERVLEALEPERVRQSYRAIDQQAIDSGCVELDTLVDLGRALFLRPFSPAEGLGHGFAAGDTRSGLHAQRRRLGVERTGSAAALSCADCHWRGGMAGAGDRADNTYLGGDGRTPASHEELHPPALWGAGWIEILATDISRRLAEQRDAAIEEVRRSGAARRVALESHGIQFGTLAVSPGGTDGATHVDTAGVEGVDPDLIVRPFGWRGRYRSLRQATVAQLHLTLGLQAEEWIDDTDRPHELAWIQSGRSASSSRRDPDGDGVRNEFTAGQLSALVAFMATLDAPRTVIPTMGPERGEFMTAELDLAPTPELTHRWGRGALVFEQIGCAGCHKPFLETERAALAPGPATRASNFRIRLAEAGASPQPEAVEGRYRIPVFSDFKRHAMGRLLAQRNAATGNPDDDRYMTRPLWGMAGTGPWMHDGRAATIDDAIALHGGEGSEAATSAGAFADLAEHDKTALRVYLMSLRRGPAIRIR